MRAGLAAWGSAKPQLHGRDVTVPEWDWGLEDEEAPQLVLISRQVGEGCFELRSRGHCTPESFSSFLLQAEHFAL